MNIGVESFEHAGLKVTIYYDEDSSGADPRGDDNLSILYCWHPDYQLGDKQFQDAEGRGAGPRRDGYRVSLPQHDTQEDAYKHIRENGATVVLPLFLYEHSGITISAGPKIEKLRFVDVDTRNRSPFDGAGWDTSWVGFAYTTEERRKELGVKRSHEEIERQMRAEIEEYDKFLRGEVYCYVVEGELGENLDSCWGFLGYEHVEEEAKRAAESAAQDIVGRELNRLPVAA